jgi:Transglutaminase-like superfamily
VSRAGTFLRLPAADRELALRAAWWLIAARIALWTLPFPRVQDLARRFGSSRRTEGIAPGRLAWTVQTTARSIPKASCLTQALAAQILLERAGERPELHFGVTTDRGEFEAHAWLELHGRPIVGDHELERFSRLHGS